MRYAHNGNTRIEAFPNGKAICQACGDELYAACGNIQVWHWRHKVKDCDPWYEGMSEWHISWQNMFPETWREVIITKDGVMHIADILTSKGKVIEFQHSSISSSEIRSREDFYKDMLWVIDAREFKENLKLRSNVKTELRNIIAEKAIAKSKTEEDLTQSLKNNKQEVHDLTRKINQLADDTTESKLKLEKYKNINSDIDKFVLENLIESWRDRRYFHSILLSKVTTPLQNHYRSSVVSIQQNINSTAREIREVQTKLDKYDNLQRVTIENKEYVTLDFEMLSSEKYYLVKAIRKTSVPTLYPEIIPIKSKFELTLYGVKRNDFYFTVDITDATTKLLKHLKLLRSTLEKFELEIESVTKLVIEDTKNILSEQIEFENYLMQSTSELLSVKKEELSDTEQILLEKEINLDREIQNAKKSVDNNFMELEREIMKNNKGYYSFTWKNERKTWRVAESPILFDVGEDYLFLKTQNNELRKVSISTFLKRLIPNDYSE